MMKYILTLLLLAPLMAISQQWVDATGDTIRVVKVTRTSSTPVYGVVAVKDSTVSFKMTVPVFGTTSAPFTYTYDSVVVIKKVTPVPVDPPPPTGQTFAFNVTQKPFTNVAVPGGKLETWSEQWNVNPGYNKQDGYFRFSWSMLEGAQGQYTFDVFKRQAEMVFARGGRFSFGIMTHYPDAVAPHRLNYDGGYSVYPQYLHDLMQAEPVKDWRASNGAWVPNWNSPAYHERLLALHKALDAYIKQQGWQDRIAYVDIRGYGAFGEWHSYTIADQMSQYPAGTRATEASLRKIVDAHVQGFPDYPLVAMVSAFDCNRLGNTMNPPGIAAYILRASNRWGKLGWRRDNWGATDDYIAQYTVRNTYVVDGMRLDTAIMNRWKYAPVVGEPCCNNNYSQLVAQLKQAGATSLGNGNYTANSTTRPNLIAAGEAIGSRLTIASGSFKDGEVTIEWNNLGNVPLYEAFNVMVELRQGSSIVWSTSAPLVQVLPGKTVQVIRGGAVPRGTFELHIFVKNNYRSYPLGITSSKVAEVRL